VRILKTHPGRHLRRGAVIAGVTATTLAVTQVAAWAAAAMTLSATAGPSGGGNTITATTSTAVFNANTAVTFNWAAATATLVACPATYPAGVTVSATAGVVQVPAPNVKVLSTSKLAITVPSTVALPTGGTNPPTVMKFAICAYNGTTVASTGVTGSALVAQASSLYTIAAKATITSVSPVTGPAQGGTTITVTGTNFPTTTGSITATLAGVPLTGIVPVNSTTFTAVTPAHIAGGPYTLSVTTSGGTTTKSNLFSYTNGIVVSPNHGPNTKATDVDILGVGFSSIDFSANTDGTNPDATSGHVYLVKDAYDPASNPTNKANGPVDECINVLPVSDTELICTLNAAQSLTAAENWATMSARTVASADSSGTTLTANGANFTQADIGLPVVVSSGTGTLAANTTIASVSNGSTAVLSAAPSVALSGATITVGGPNSVTGVGTTGGSNAVTAGSGAFTAADVGRIITGTNIPAGTSITSVNSGGGGATLSNPVGGTGTATITATVSNPVAVPVGTYTLTVVSNGAIDANTTGDPNFDSNYTQSIISSGSTFTVADY
jgi:IPT/TIG domain